LLLLAPCFPDHRPSALATFSLARRNQLLLRLREATIGPSLQALVRCPACRTPLEFSMTVRELRDAAGDRTQEEDDTAEAVFFDDGALHFRLPNSRDLAAASEFLDVPEAARTVWRRVAAPSARGLAADTELRAASAVQAAIEQHHPLVDVRVPLRCVCEHVWAASLDIAAFVWTELDRVAKRLLDDVQALARGYGWHEADILAMSEGRRQFYLEALRT
jgi:hypothetical protein